MDDEEYWFEPKRYGYGAGRPKTWQAWVLVAGYSLTVVAAAFLILPYGLVGFLAITLSATTLFLVVCANRTRGGWRWRWGKDDPPPIQGTKAKRRS